MFACCVFSAIGSYYYYGGQGVNGPLANEVRERAEENGRVSRFRSEGFCVGNLDANGYNNAFYVERGLDVAERPNVLVMGSSHGEAYNVPMQANLTYRLNLKFENDKEEKTFYSCARSGHAIAMNAARCDDALRFFKPKEYLILELWHFPGALSVEKGINDGYPNKSPASPLIVNAIKWIHGLPWARNIFLTMRGDEIKAATESSPEELELAWSALVKHIVKAAENNDVKPIIFFHRVFNLEKDGSISPSWDVEELALFRAICEREGVVFVDATERFREEYEKNNVWPYGFCNAGIISGHLNRDGHRIIADVLEEKIRELEAENKESEAKQ